MYISDISYNGVFMVFRGFFVASGKEGSLLRKSWLMLVYRKASPIYMTIFICLIDTIILLVIKFLK